MYDLSPMGLAAIVVAGVGSGFINTIAGGGSLLTLPALMLIGLPPDLANGTNRVSVIAQSASTVQGFHREGKFDTRAFFAILIPCALGALVGSLIASWVPPSLLGPILLGAMMAMALLMLLFPSAVAPPEGAKAFALKEKPLAVIALFFVGCYGGFVQAGVGFISLMVLGPLLRYDLVRAHALKIAISGLFGVIPLAVFLYYGKVLWIPGMILAVATVVGSRLGVRFAIDAKQETLKWILFACVTTAAGAAALKMYWAAQEAAQQIP